MNRALTVVAVLAGLLLGARLAGILRRCPQPVDLPDWWTDE